MKTELMGDKKHSPVKDHTRNHCLPGTLTLTLAVRFSCRSWLLFVQVCFRTQVWVLTFLLAKVHRVLFGLPLDYKSTLVSSRPGPWTPRVHWAMS